MWLRDLTFQPVHFFLSVNIKQETAVIQQSLNQQITAQFKEMEHEKVGIIIYNLVSFFRKQYLN